jgi:hypothetical protein
MGKKTKKKEEDKKNRKKIKIKKKWKQIKKKKKNSAFHCGLESETHWFFLISFF